MGAVMTIDQPPGNGNVGHHRAIIADLVVLLALVAAFVFFAWRSDFVSDDAFISFRYARNLVDGNGLTFNPGERVEGFSNLLFVLLIAGLHAAGLDPVAAGRLIGLAAGVLLICVAYRLVLVAAGASARLFAGIAVAALACNAYVAVWSRGGLETTLYALLILCTALPLAARGCTRRSFFWSSLAACALTLTRLEGVAVYALLLLWALAVSRERRSAGLRDLLPGVGVYITALALMTLWRFAYYGELVPNTFFTKSGFTLNHAWRGIVYLQDFAQNLYVAPALVLAGLSLLSLRRKAVPLLLLLLAELMLIVVAEGGDGLPAYRFIVPLLAPLFILTGVGASALAGRLKALWRPLELLAFAALLTLVPLSRLMERDVQYRLYDSQTRFEVPTWTFIGTWLKNNVPPGTTLATIPIGAVSYYSGLPMIDMMGLTDSHIAKRPVASLGAGWAGHEKSDGPYVLSRRPDILLLGNIFVSRAPLSGTGNFPPHYDPSTYARERDLVSDPRFASEYRYAALPLGNGLFLHVFVRKGFQPLPGTSG